RLKDTVFIAKSRVDHCQARRETGMLRHQGFGLGAPAHHSVRVPAEIVTAGAKLLQDPQGLVPLAMLKQRSRQKLSVNFLSETGLRARGHHETGVLDGVVKPASTDLHGRGRARYVQ